MPRATSTFTVDRFEPQTFDRVIESAADISYVRMTKTYTGQLVGSSDTVFFGALNQQSQSGTYVAIECVEATLEGKTGTFNVAHASTMQNSVVTQSFLNIVPESATADLAGLSGTGRTKSTLMGSID